MSGADTRGRAGVIRVRQDGWQGSGGGQGSAKHTTRLLESNILEELWVASEPVERGRETVAGGTLPG